MGMVNEGGTEGLSGKRSTRKRSLTEGGDLGSGAVRFARAPTELAPARGGIGAGALGICAGARTAVAAKRIPPHAPERCRAYPLPRTIPGSHAIECILADRAIDEKVPVRHSPPAQSQCRLMRESMPPVRELKRDGRALDPRNEWGRRQRERPVQVSRLRRMCAGRNALGHRILLGQARAQ